MYYIGIDLGGTNIAAGLVDESCRIVGKKSIPTNLPRSADEILHDIAALVQTLIQSQGVSAQDIAWIGVGCPGTANRDTGIIEYANNLRFENVPLRDILQKLSGRPVFIENDANVAAYGEFLAGAAKGCSSAVAITLGTGVGGGIIIDKKIYAGFNFAGAELGHMVIEYNGRPCTCGRKGCWEAYSSATALIHMTKESMMENRHSAMWEIAEGSPDNVGGKTAFQAMRAGDSAGTAVVNQYLDYLACGILNIINIFQPEVLCIGGGISKEGDHLLTPLNHRISAGKYSKNSEKQTQVCIARLGNDAGIIGAALLGRME